jgi:hypothetical protein
MDVRDLADPNCRTCDGLGAYPTRGDYRTEWVRCPCTEDHDTDTEENDDA